MPPKNMTSVARKSHMPKDDAWRCCSMSAKWCWSAALCRSTATGLSANLHLLRKWDVLVIVGFPVDHRRVVEIKSWRRGRGRPFQTGSTPRIGLCDSSIAHRPQEIHHREKITYCENGGTSGGEHVQHLEFRRVLPVATWHSEVAQNEL